MQTESNKSPKSKLPKTEAKVYKLKKRGNEGSWALTQQRAVRKTDLRGARQTQAKAFFLEKASIDLIQKEHKYLDK